MPRTKITLGLATLALVTALTVGDGLFARPLDPDQEARVQPAGKPVNCLQLPQISESRVRDDRTIDFIMVGGQVYRNRLPNSCPELGFEERFAHETSIQEICSSDTITVLHGGGGLARGASCGLGEFQPVSGVPR
jgi:hypothetical protein